MVATKSVNALPRFRGSGKHALVLCASVLGVMQYGLVLMFGSVLESLQGFYGISESEADFLYTMSTVGSCALSFVAGLIFDRCGAEAAMLVGTLVGAVPLVCQLSWGAAVPSWIGTMPGLSAVYLLFGMAATVFNIVGCFAPLAAFSEANAGKVGAVVQVCLSLGMSFQNQVFELIQSSEENKLMTFVWYSLLFTAGSGFIMLLALRRCRSLLQPKEVQEEEKLEASTILQEPPSLVQMVLSKDFAFMVAVFSCGIGFSFSFLGYEAKMAAAAGANITVLWNIFSVLNALARLVVGFAADATRTMRYGGPTAYVAGSMLVLAAGLLCLVLPSDPGAGAMQVANGLVGLGYGGMLGMVPIALRLQFGTRHLGVLCGLLYGLVSMAQPLWSLLAKHSSACLGLGCYSFYNAAGAAGCIIAALLGCGLVAVEAQRKGCTKSADAFLQSPEAA